MCLPVSVDEVLSAELQEFEEEHALNKYVNIISVIQFYTKWAYTKWLFWPIGGKRKLQHIPILLL